jgi:glycosyltransferase involved in cell wall biosynthesis
VRNWGVPAARIRCIGNGVALDRFKPEPRDKALRAAWNAGPESFVLGFVGTFAAYEGLDTLLDAAALLRARGVDAKVVLIGNGEMEPRLRALARRLGVPLHFGGRVSHDQVPRLLSAIDCCPFPRRAAGATLLVPPLKLGEAMACAVPVIVADIPPLTEMVRDGETGHVVAYSTAALADGLERVWRDRQGSRAMAEAARSWIVQNRSWQILVDRLLQVWVD